MPRYILIEIENDASSREVQQAMLSVLAAHEIVLSVFQTQLERDQAEHHKQGETLRRGDR